MKRLTIIYHSRSGGTEAMAQAVLRGARSEEQVESVLVRAFDAGLEDLKHSDALIFGTPENFGYMSGALKDFFDRTYDDTSPLQLNLPYALFVSAGNDGSGAVREVDRILRGYPMRKVAEPVIAVSKTESTTTAARETILLQCEELGATLATGLGMGIF
jgi:multimeric flavodoxin WrbA